MDGFMRKDTIFDKEFIKQLRKTHKSHQEFDAENHELKLQFKKNISNMELEIIIDTVVEYGYQEQIENVKKFRELVNSGNYDDVNIEIFKEIVENYNDEIMEALKKKQQRVKNEEITGPENSE